MIREVLQNFHVFLETRDYDSLATTVVPDLIVIAAGEKYDNWQDYLEQVLTPLASKPSPNNTWQIDKLVVTPGMAWAYTTTAVTLRRQGETVDTVVWTSFVLERRASTVKTSSAEGDWKIVYVSVATKRSPGSSGAAPTPASKARGK